MIYFNNIISVTVYYLSAITWKYDLAVNANVITAGNLMQRFAKSMLV